MRRAVHGAASRPGPPRIAPSHEATYKTDLATNPSTVIAEPSDINPDPDTAVVADFFERFDEREITCPACQGRHRVHTKDSHCRLGPPPQPARSDLNPFDRAPLFLPEGGGMAVDPGSLGRTTGLAQLAADVVATTGTTIPANSGIERGELLKSLIASSLRRRV